MIRKNEHMDALFDRIDAYEREYRKYEMTKEEMRNDLGSDFWAWVKDNKPPKYPLTRGQNKALHLWANAENDNPDEELVWDDSVWEDEVEDFVETLRKAGVRRIVITNSSTLLMENMHWLKREGCQLVGLCEVETGHKHWKTGEPEVKIGVRFAI